jgi:AGZA family xanthine/uracil permease-like MFS transporter
MTFLERQFGLTAQGTSVRTEVLAGFTTFLTMAYIVIVNPAILGQAGMPIAAVAAATCLAAGFGSILMGLIANYPIALAPGMGLNAYFTFTVVKGMGLPWETALGCVFLSGVAFLVLTVAGIRQLIVGAIPRPLFSAVAAGVGLFIAFIGLKEAGIIVADPATTVALGDLTKPTAALAILGLLVMGGLMVWRVKGAILIGILVAAIAAWALGLAKIVPGEYGLAALSATAFKLDIPAAMHLKGGAGMAIAEVIFVFLFVDLFDNVGTLVAVTKKAGLVAPDGTIPRLNRILTADSIATIGGSLAGTSTVVSYIESASGVAAGGRTGLTLGPGHPGRGHRAGPDHRRFDDGWRPGRRRLGRSGRGDPRLPDGHRHPADLLDRQRPGLRHHRLCCPEAGARPGQAQRLAAVRPGRPVRGALHLHGGCLKAFALRPPFG